MNQESGQAIISDLNRMEESIRTSWQDSYGQQYALWLQQTGESVKQMELSRENCAQRLQQIRRMLQEIVEDAGNDPEKVKKKVR